MIVRTMPPLSFPDEHVELAGETVYGNRGVANHLAVDFHQGTEAVYGLDNQA